MPPDAPVSTETTPQAPAASTPPAPAVTDPPVPDAGKLAPGSMTSPPPEPAAPPEGAAPVAPEATPPVAPATPPVAPATPPAKPQAKGDEPPAEGEFKLTMPQETLLPVEAVNSVIEFAKANSLSTEIAQAMLIRESESVELYHQSNINAWAKEQENWVDAMRADPEIGGVNQESYDQNRAFAAQAIARFGSSELIAELEKTGFGDYPNLVRCFMKIGKAMSEDSSTPPGPRGPTTRDEALASPEKVMYPEMT